MRPTIESAIPRRSAGTTAGSKPAPWSRTNAVTASSSTSTYTLIAVLPEWTRRVGHRLGARVDEAAQPLVHLGVADDDGLDADLVLALDPPGHRVDRVAQPDAGQLGRAPVEPGAQLALLGAGEAHHLALAPSSAG